jgi:hypothetical protein
MESGGLQRIAAKNFVEEVLHDFGWLLIQGEWRGWL